MPFGQGQYRSELVGLMGSFYGNKSILIHSQEHSGPEAQQVVTPQEAPVCCRYFLLGPQVIPGERPGGWNLGPESFPLALQDGKDWGGRAGPWVAHPLRTGSQSALRARLVGLRGGLFRCCPALVGDGQALGQADSEVVSLSSCGSLGFSVEVVTGGQGARQGVSTPAQRWLPELWLSSVLVSLLHGGL